MKQNYFKIGLYITGTIVVLIIFYQIYRMVMKVKSDSDIIADSLHDANQDNEVSGVYHLDKTAIAKCRKIALDLANEMETNPKLGWQEKAGNLAYYGDVIKIWSSVKSANEAKVVANFYKNQFTENNDLYRDLLEVSKSPFGSVNFKSSDFPYVENIINH